MLGRNGSGKSTLLTIIFGIEPADFKFVRLDGIVKTTTKNLFQEIRYLSQESFIPNHFTVTKTISLSIAKNKLNEFYQDEFIQNLKDKKVSHLSGGELRYLEIKLILCSASYFVLLDEPYNGLSPLMIEEVNCLIRTHSPEKGIIITDHNYENVIAIATKLVLIKEGKVHHLKSKDELIEKGYLREGAF